ncbi:MAG: GTPase HflX [SAR202 cluster bacterium]|nr:GTPase HflX [SAR202 cluster bacterium]HAE33323.1 GTPase HflX [Dehalococcoidia bacterium]
MVRKLVDVKRRKERALLIGVRNGRARQVWRLKDSVKELGELASSAGAEVVGTITQNLSKHSNTYLGKGKIEELKDLAADLELDTVICDDELNPNQQLNLEKALDGVKVIDRTALILDIFAANALTKEGRLQVELAQHEYLLPRLAGQWTHLERLGGGIGTRGPGESQIETDRRLARGRILRLKKDIEKVRQHRSRYRERRRSSEAKIVALVGYTNAGKSTLLNSLTSAEVVAENRMFSTLDPVTRRLKLPSGSDVLLTDTVGFIQKLPTTLIAAFRATLEEINEADLILHVLDVTHDRRVEHSESVKSIIAEIGLTEKPIVTILNKWDKFPHEYDPFSDDPLRQFIEGFESAIFCSGLSGVGKTEILRTIGEKI